MEALMMAAAARQTPEGVTFGLALGITLAVVCSWQRNRSILWGILHGLLSWFYVIYFAFTRRESEEKPAGDGLSRDNGATARPGSFQDFLRADPVARHLDGDEQMRRFLEWRKTVD